MSWGTYKFGDFLHRSKIPIDIEDGKEYKRVTIKTKHQGVSVRDTEKGKKIGTKKQFVLKAGQFVLSKIDARYGAFGIAADEVEGAVITGNFWAYDVDFSIINIEWFNQFTNSQDFYDVCERASSGITHRKYLNEDFFLNYEIELPDVEEQLAIVEEFKKNKITLETQYTELTYQLDLVKQLRQAFLREAMQGKLVPQDENDEPASVLLEKIKAEKERLIKDPPAGRAGKKIKKHPPAGRAGKPLSPITEEDLPAGKAGIPFDIPENWVWCRLGEICEKIGSGSTPKGSNYADKGYPFFRSQNIHDTGLVFDDIKYISEKVQTKMNGTVVNPNDILLNITGGSLGRCAHVPSDFESGNVSQHVCIVRPISCDNSFVHKLILSPLIQQYIFQSTTGTGREGLPKYNLEQFVLPLPPLSEQQRIVAKLDELMAYCDELEAGIKESQQQNELLLQQVLREALEPASVNKAEYELNMAAEPKSGYGNS